MSKQIRQAAVVLMFIVTSSAVVRGQTTADQGKAPSAPAAVEGSPWMRIWVGGSVLQMDEFAATLRSQQNNPIKNAFEVGIEVDAIPVPIPVLKSVTVKIPLGTECMNASSRTVHGANGASATVNWQLPICGAYVSPRLSFRRGPLLINLRPIGIGYYTLGPPPMNAELVISDRPGSLSAKANSWGYLGIGGVEYPLSKASILLEAGYRVLRFTDVALVPQNGFTTGVGGALVQASSLPQALDFSGVTVRVGIGIHF